VVEDPGWLPLPSALLADATPLSLLYFLHVKLQFLHVFSIGHVLTAQPTSATHKNKDRFFSAL
jgi:hypothetical protein